VIGDFLYALTARDQQAALLEPVIAARLSTLALASFSVAFQVPSGRAMLLKSFVMRATATGGQTINTVQFRVTRLDQSANIAANAFLAAPPVDWFLQTANMNDIILMPLDILEAQATFSAGVAVNTISLDLNGLLIPRGSLGFGALIQL